MVVNFMTTFSKTFSWVKICKCRLRFHCSLFSNVQLTLKGCRRTGIDIPTINLRRPDDRLRFIMGIPIPIIRCFLSVKRPRSSSITFHDGVIKWKHFSRYWPFVRGIQWKHFSRYWPFVRGIHRSAVNSPRNLDVFFDLRLNKRVSKQPWGWWFEMPSSP